RSRNRRARRAVSTRPNRVLIIKAGSMIFKPRAFLRALAPLLLAFVGTAACAAALPQPVASALSAAGIPSSAVHVVVQELGARRPALSVNPAEAVNPASVMKLVTTYSALELLGPAFQW